MAAEKCFFSFKLIGFEDVQLHETQNCSKYRYPQKRGQKKPQSNQRLGTMNMCQMFFVPKLVSTHLYLFTLSMCKLTPN
jgi:hypothetical protein